MKPEIRYFDVAPKVVPADQKSVIEIRPLFGHCRFKPDADYQVTYYPTEEFAQRNRWPDERTQTLRTEEGVLRIPQYFEDEQEHVLVVEETYRETSKEIGQFRVYSVQDDLFGRRPYKGDMHMHSNYSDGRESPGYVAGACRQIGLDFMALTDHGQYPPSVESQRVFEGVQIDLCIFRG